MDLAAKTKKIKDEEKESKFGYVHGVSGPGKYTGPISLYLLVSIICLTRT